MDKVNIQNTSLEQSPSAKDLRKSCSIVLQDNYLERGAPHDNTAIFDISTKTAECYGTDLNEKVVDNSLVCGNSGESDLEQANSRKNTLPFERHKTLNSFCGEDHYSRKSPNAFIKDASSNPFITNPQLSLDPTIRQRGPVHLQSADLFENFSPVQKQRSLWIPTLPNIFAKGESIQLNDVEAPELIQYDAEKLSSIYPNIFNQQCIEIVRSDINSSLDSTLMQNCSPLRVGIVLSGGPAPGGHNVISGLFDYIKRHNPESQLFGFMGGFDGLFQGKYRVITSEFMDRFRNQGGFDMLWSGRGRINCNEDLYMSQEVCSDLAVQGLVIVGGDGSLSNAARLAEYFAENLPSCVVIGVPKTIDGDLKNPWITTSFGFDTAAKTYSEVIGNLCTDVTTGQQVYHFVRVMGRSASHLVLECALQTRPNLVFLGEEVEAKHLNLRDIVDEIIDLILARRDKGKLFGMVLVPEGLIEFIPEMKLLISELNNLMIYFGREGTEPLSPTDITKALTNPAAVALWKFLPETIQEQLLVDREASGYIQVARIATERLLKLLVENELQQRNISLQEIICMPHYFGYEGRCATPSNFDANYCYLLGYTAGCLIQKNKTGYISVARHLDLDPSLWLPAAIPFTRIMHIKKSSNNSTFPAVMRQLVDLNGALFNVFSEVREKWKLKDYYRCPGPIQFEGPVSGIANYTVVLPTKNDLLDGTGLLGLFSDLQKYRLLDRPELPSLCKNRHARAVAASQYLPKDPFTQRQVSLCYPYLCNRTQFYLQEVVEDSCTSPVEPGLRVAVVFLSRQAPGVTNILWGIYQRIKLVKGRCFGFFSKDGILTQRYIEITDKTLELHLNLGGMSLLGRASLHSLLTPENQEKARITCENLFLDGLIIVGSSLAMTEAAVTTEYFLSKGCRTSVIGVPATGSNNLSHELIETNVGFDTSSKVYASLIGNVLTDAASMPKYWHFVRLMGRQPSNEVLECALQTHPNVVIIAEEYGAGNKTLVDVVTDIADVVVKRANMGKNFGAVLIPDGLLMHLPNMNSLMNELTTLIKEAESTGSLNLLQNQLENIEKFSNTSANDQNASNSSFNWISRITPWSMALFKSLPKFIRRELTHVDMGEMRFTLIETELLLSQMVQQELERRKKKGLYHGKFMAVCHFFGYQGRSAMPSRFDAQLAFAFGHLAAICVESGLTGYCTTIRGLCGTTQEWKLGAIPFNSMLKFTAQQESCYLSDIQHGKNDMPIIPSAEVNLNGKAYRWLRSAVGQWQLQDRFCNPGPVQFHGKAADFYHRILHEEQADYFHMLRHVQLSARILKETCSFGVDEGFLKVVYANLNALLLLRFHQDDLVSYLPAFVDIQKYDARKKHIGQRPELRMFCSHNKSIDNLSDRTSTQNIPQKTNDNSHVTVASTSEASLVSESYASLKPQVVTSSVQSGESGNEGKSVGDSRTVSASDMFLPDGDENISFASNSDLTRLDPTCSSVVQDAGWGNQPGVEAYPC